MREHLVSIRSGCAQLFNYLSTLGKRKKCAGAVVSCAKNRMDSYQNRCLSVGGINCRIVLDKGFDGNWAKRKFAINCQMLLTIFFTAVIDLLNGWYVPVTYGWCNAFRLFGSDLADG